MLLIGNELLTDGDATEDDNFADRRLTVSGRFESGDGVTADLLSLETLPKVCWKFVDIDRDACVVHACIIDDGSFCFSFSFVESLILSIFSSTLSDIFTKPVFLFCLAFFIVSDADRVRPQQ